MAIKWRVDELVARRGWTAHVLAERAGVDVKTARNIVKGRATRVDLDTISRIAEALGVAPGALWRRGENRQASRRWEMTAGATGRSTAEELTELLAGREDDTTTPALERAVG